MNTRPDVGTLLNGLHNLDTLKKLFYSTLEYERENTSLFSHHWPESFSLPLAENPTLLASAGENRDFHVIYTRLKSEKLLLTDERPVIHQLLKDHPYALFIFSNSSQNRWHFVNVKYDVKQEKRRVFRRITIGPEEQLRTATERITLLDLSLLPPTMFGASPLQIQQKHDEAFDVEKVTQKFYEEYDRVFKWVEQQIQGFGSDKNRCRLFTQRLFNRLMFIAFIQKKGWLKLGSTNPAEYLLELWKSYKKAGDGQNFYNERLKLLFFTALNTPHDVNVIGIQKQGVLNTLIGEVPYLNGGLFEQDEDDKNDLVIVPDKAIELIFDELFKRFNFTVTESTPFDVEVAVDPEMLGKVFEELVTGRHESGSYYTPKPIVSFMCREALKGYLEKELPAEQIQALAQFVDEQQPQNLNDPEAVLDALKRVKVCDPACGSGAYLLGMLHELLDLRACLFASRKLDAVSIYQRKLEIIQQNLYGVDIDPFAVNIARLRLWLSLAVDYDKPGDPPPLPNLKFKIAAGDSLLEPLPETSQLALQQAIIDAYSKAKGQYLITGEPGQKRQLEQEIGEYKDALKSWIHQTQGGVKGFDWQIEFAEVFARGGFDIVVANPPYVRQELISSLKPTLQKVFPATYNGTSDLYCYFYARALQTLRPGGVLSFISPNKWFRANYGGNLRKHIAATCQVRNITDFGDLPVFQTATTYPMIFVAAKTPPPGASPVFTQVKTLTEPYPDVLAIIRQSGQLLPAEAIKGENWTLTDNKTASRMQLMEKAGIPLGEYVKGQIYRGILTGFNTAFVIDGAKRAELIAKDPKSAEIIKPLAQGKDISKWRLNYQDKWLIFTRRGINIDNYAVIKNYLEQWKDELTPKKTGKEEKGRKPGSYKWCEIQDEIAYYSEFDKPKIIWGNLGLEPRFAFSSQPLYTLAPANIIPLNDFYLLGIMNSTIAKQFFAEIAIQRNGNYLEFKPIYVKQLPIPNASPTEKVAIAGLVQKCLDAKGVGCEVWEAEINERVAKLYGL